MTITRVVNGYILNTSIGRDNGYAEQRKSVARDEAELGALVRRWAQSGTPAKKPARTVTPAA